MRTLDSHRQFAGGRGATGGSKASGIPTTYTLTTGLTFIVGDGNERRLETILLSSI